MGETQTGPEIHSFSGCFTADSHADDDLNQLNNNIKILTHMHRNLREDHKALKAEKQAMELKVQNMRRQELEATNNGYGMSS